MTTRDPLQLMHELAEMADTEEERRFWLDQAAIESGEIGLRRALRNIALFVIGVIALVVILGLLL